MMIGIEKDILILVSKIRCITETQVGKFFGTKKRYSRKPFKKTLRKMCNEYTLRKYPCNINYSGFFLLPLLNYQYLTINIYNIVMQIILISC